MTGSPPQTPSPESKTVETTTNEENKLENGPGAMEETAEVIDHKAERRLCLRFDIRILPVLAVMCECSAICLLSRY